MKLTLEEWIILQKSRVEVSKGKEEIIPKAIFIGTLKNDGIIESKMKLVSESEWKEFRDIWKQVSRQSNSICKECLPSHPPQFFLFVE